MNPQEATGPPSEDRGTYVVQLAKDLLDDLELGRLAPEALLLKATRLARLAGTEERQQWLEWELVGYPDTEAAHKYMDLTNRWTNRATNTAYWGPLAEIEGHIAALRLELQALRVPDITYSPSSANPHEIVTMGASQATSAAAAVVARAGGIAGDLARMSGIRSRVLAVVHYFATSVYHEKRFSGMAQSIFEDYEGRVDALLARHAGKALERLSASYDRLAQGDRESISQALTSCRRAIDAFSDAVFPPTNDEREVGGRVLKLTAEHTKNRLEVWIRDRVPSKSRRDRMLHQLAGLRDRTSAAVHAEVAADEARAVVLGTYLLLGECIALTVPDVQPPSPETAPQPEPPRAPGA